MTDGFQTSGGQWLAGDDIDNVVHPRVKVQYGPNDTALDVSPTNPLPVAVMSVGASSVSIAKVDTSATGANFVAFADISCGALEIVNATGTTVEYRRGGTGEAMPILNATSRKIVGITNADQISVRRLDQSNTPVAVVAEAFA